MLKFPISLIKHNTKINFLSHRYLAFGTSSLLTVIALVLFLIQGLNLSIDFTGGMIIEITYDNSLQKDKIEKTLSNIGYHNPIVQEDNNHNLIIRLQSKSAESHVSQISNIQQSMVAELGNLEFRKIDYVGPRIGKELISKSILAVILALAAMMIYVAIRFNLVCGIGIVIALIHDIIATLGFFIISKIEFDLNSIAAILTIIGYSVNDSVVIYDRIRENIKKYKDKNMMDLINLSINETLSRTIMTAATTLVVCLALILFGGNALTGFGAALFFGIAFGTYSSIYISAPLLIYFTKEKRFYNQKSFLKA